MCVLDDIVKRYVQVWAAFSALSSQVQPVPLWCFCADPVAFLLFCVELSLGSLWQHFPGVFLYKGHSFYRCPSVKDKGPKLQSKLYLWISEAGRRWFDCASWVILPLIHKVQKEVLAKREVCVDHCVFLPWETMGSLMNVLPPSASRKAF